MDNPLIADHVTTSGERIGTVQVHTCIVLTNLKQFTY